MKNRGRKQPVNLAHWCAVGVMIALFGFYPLYMDNGYFGIDAAKNAALLVIAKAGLAILIAGSIYQIMRYDIPLQVKQKLSLTDIFMLAYSCLVIMSVICSDTRETAWSGEDGWFVGGMIIILFNLLYFLISRFWTGDEIVIRVLLVVSAFVFFIGFLNRFSIWPFEIGGSFNSSFLSTLGNIGWYNGYLSVVATIGIAIFVLKQEQTRNEKIIMGIYTGIVFLTALSQGGDTIILYFLALFVCLLFISSFYEDGVKRWLEMFIIWGISGQILHLMRWINDEWYSYDVNNALELLNNRFTTLWMLIPAVIVYWWFCKHKVSPLINKAIRLLPVMIVVAVAIWLVSAIVYTNSDNVQPDMDYAQEGTYDSLANQILYLDDNWGSGRGITIKTGAKVFGTLPVLRKLIGVGPDCFAQYAYTDSELSDYLSNYFDGEILANAHSEPITSIVNIGILGTIAYYGIWITFLYSCCKKWKEEPRVLVIAVSIVCYLTYNLLNYAQILNFPFMFMLLAMGEAWLKQTKCIVTNHKQKKSR